MFLLLSLLSCDKDETKEPESSPADVCDPVAAQADAPALTTGVPLGGVAEGFLDLPVGTPLSGYTSRCTCFGNSGKADLRKSAYAYSFNASAGAQTRIPVKAFWIGNGDQDLVILKIDVIYSFDGLVEEMERRLSAATGKDMDGKVVVATSHSHASYGDFSDQVTFYLGSDRFNYEVFERMATTAEETAMTAYDGLQPVKIGVGYQKDWDPQDQVYHDRRGDNDSLQFFDDIPAGSYKDPWLTMMRIDTLDDQPLGVLFNFGIHGTTLDGDSPMISVDAPGHVELAFQEEFDTPVVVALLQGGAGDSSPSGSDDGYARLETVGHAAADPLYALWNEIPTAADPIRLETASRSIAQTHDDIYITRGGTTDLRYLPITTDETFVPDNVVYGSDGKILSPIDEFNSPNGSAFCGEDPAYLPGYAPAEVFPYVNCVSVDLMANLIKGFFDLTEEEVALPLGEARKAAITASRIGPLAIRETDGTITSDDFFMGFFPGEATAMYTEQFRRRAKAELGYEHAMAVGYAQDHEGYLLIPEDWLTGGYEIDINVWGPLQGEHILERLLEMSAEVLATDVVEHPDPCGLYTSTDYGEHTLPTLAPDLTPEAGTLLSTAPDYLYTPLQTEEERDAGVVVELTVPAEVQRVQGLLEMAWIGGDPGVDFPIVTLEMQGEGGEWETVTMASGRPVAAGPDILTTTTPDPLYPLEDVSTYTWWAAWQAVGHDDEVRSGLPLGTYRLHVEGESWAGGDDTWPWTTEPYSVDGPSFELVPATVSVSTDGASVYASLAGPARGYRLIAMNGSYRGDNPLSNDTATVTFVDALGLETTESVTGSHSGGKTVLTTTIPLGTVRIEVTDEHGNQGSVEL